MMETLGPRCLIVAVGQFGARGATAPVRAFSGRSLSAPPRFGFPQMLASQDLRDFSRQALLLSQNIS
jgi:hypothetical protein